MAVKQASPFSEIDKLFDDSPPAPAPSLLALARDMGLRVTSGYSAGGHNTGSRHYQGDKEHPGAIDIDHRNVAPETIQAIRSQGYRVLDERTRPKGQAVWGGPHYHIDLGSGKPAAKSQPSKGKAQPAQAPRQMGNAPPAYTLDAIDQQLSAGQDIAPSPAFLQNVQQLNQQATAQAQPVLPAPVNISTPQAAKQDNNQWAAIDKLLNEKPEAPRPQVKTAQGGFDLGKILQDTASQVAGGFQTQMANSPINAKDPGDFLYKSLVSQNPFVQAGAGALSETANFANGITDLAGFDKPIPTGGLNDFTAQAPAFSTVGRALPYIVGEGAVLKAGEKLLPGATKAVMSNPVSRTLAGAGVNAAEGYLVDPGDTGDEGRLLNAGLGAGLGGALHAGGEIAGLMGKKAPVELNPAYDGQPKNDFITQGDRLRSAAINDATGPGKLNPVEATANPQELTQAFRERGADLGQPTRNIDAQIVGADGKPIQSQAGGINKTPYQIALERNREPIDLAGPTPQIETASAPTGRTNVEGGQFQPDLSPARQSADVLFSKQGDIEAATQLREEAITRLQNAENQLTSVAGVEDVAEAQRAIGSRINELESKASKQALTPIEREDLAANRAMFDEVMNARKDVLDAEPLVQEASAVTPRSSIETPTVKENLTVQEPVIARQEPTITNSYSQPKPFEKPVSPKQPIDLAAPSAKNALPQESPILTPRSLDAEPTGQLIDTQGRPLAREMAGKANELVSLSKAMPEETPRILDASGEPMAPRDLAQPTPTKTPPLSAEPQSPPVIEGNTAKTTTGKEVYTQGRQAEDVQRLVQQIENNKKGEQLANYADAQKLLLDKQKAGLLVQEDATRQLDTLNLFLESGKNNVTFDSVRRELKSGGEVKVRDDLNPFAITVGSRKPATEIRNLMQEYNDPSVVQAKMRELAAKFGITPTTKSYGKTPEIRTKSNARQIAKQIAEHPQGRLYFQDVYLNAHNFRTGGARTAFEAPRSYPLRTFEQGAVGKTQSVIPTGSQNQNAIAQQFQALKDISSSQMVSPELKQRVDKMLQKPYPSRKDITDVRKLLQDPKVLEQFCNIFGHGA